VIKVAGAVFFHAELRVGPAAMRGRDGRAPVRRRETNLKYALVLLCQIAEIVREFMRFAFRTPAMPNMPKLTTTGANSPILAGNRAIDLTK
jgi:hypothetical protein